MKDIIPPAKKLIEDHNTEVMRDHHELSEHSATEAESREEKFYEIPIIRKDTDDTIGEKISNAFGNVSLRGKKEERAFESLYQKERPTKDTYMPLEEESHFPYKRIIMIVVAILIVGGAGLATFVFNSASITVQAKRETVSVDTVLTFKDEDITAGKDIKQVNESENLSKPMIRRGERSVDTKAEGKIVIYNNFDSKPQKLVKNTRFEGTNGKIYRISDAVTVPGMSGSIPGSVEVTVSAESSGAAFNSAPMDFTIPGFAGTPRFNGFFARSKGELSGGFSGTVAVLAPDDVSNARKEIEETLKAKLVDKIQKTVPEGFVLVPSSLTYKTTDNEKALLTDDKADFNVTVIVSGYMLSEAYISNTLLDKNNIKADTHTVENVSELTISPTDNTTNASGYLFKVTGNASVSSNVSEDQVKKLLAGASKSDFDAKLATIEGVGSGTSLEVRPMWLSSIPDDIHKITVKIVK